MTPVDTDVTLFDVIGTYIGAKARRRPAIKSFINCRQGERMGSKENIDRTKRLSQVRKTRERQPLYFHV